MYLVQPLGMTAKHTSLAGILLFKSLFICILQLSVIKSLRLPFLPFSEHQLMYCSMVAVLITNLGIKSTLTRGE